VPLPLLTATLVLIPTKNGLSGYKNSIEYASRQNPAGNDGVAGIGASRHKY